MEKPMEISPEKIQKAMEDNQIKSDGSVEELKMDLANIRHDKKFDTWDRLQQAIDEVFKENNELTRNYDLTYELIDMGVPPDNNNFVVKIISTDEARCKSGRMTEEEEKKYKNNHDPEEEQVIKILEKKIQKKLG